MIPRFGRPLPQLSMIASEVTSFVYDIYHEELRIMQNSIKDADYLPFLTHISPRMSGHLENSRLQQDICLRGNTLIYACALRKKLEFMAMSSKQRLLRKVCV